MKIFRLFTIITFALLFVACPYNSEVPLGAANEKVPTQMLGKWLSPSDAIKEDKEMNRMPEYRKKLTPTYYVISALDKTSMKIEKYEFQSSSGTYSTTLHTAHITTIGNTTFLNIKPSDENKFYFYKIVFPDDKSLELHPVTEYIKETFTSSAALKSYFNKYKELDFFYSVKEEYKKR